MVNVSSMDRLPSSPQIAASYTGSKDTFTVILSPEAIVDGSEKSSNSNHSGSFNTVIFSTTKSAIPELDTTKVQSDESPTFTLLKS